MGQRIHHQDTERKLIPAAAETEAAERVSHAEIRDLRPESQRQARLQHMASAPPVQLKKTQMPALNLMMKTHLISDGKDQYYQNTDGPDVKRTKIWNKLQAVYQNRFEAGLGKWKDFQAQQVAYKSGIGGVQEALTEKRADYDDRYASHYATKIKNLDKKKHIFEAVSQGYEGEKGDPNGSAYLNRFDLKQGIIYGAHNYAERDEAREADVKNKNVAGYKPIGLPNSELIWDEFKDAIHTKYAKKKAKKMQKYEDQEIQNLNKIIRENVQNNITHQTVFTSYPDGAGWNQDMTFTPDQEEFIALLSTPNVLPALFILTDHMDELQGRSIRNIKTTAAQNIEINIG